MTSKVKLTSLLCSLTEYRVTAANRGRMAALEDALLTYPELKEFFLPDVHPTGRSIGEGAYGSVEEGEISGEICAVKRYRDFSENGGPNGAVRKAAAVKQLLEGCHLLSTLRHRHIVEFLGVCLLPGSPVPALVTEMLADNMHDLLETRPNIPLKLKRSLLGDVARGLSFLHTHSPPLSHSNLTARNVLVDSSMVAKIGDLGITRITPTRRNTPGPHTAFDSSVYMPPEVLGESVRGDMMIDVFSLGVVGIFALTQIFPKNVLPRFYEDEQHTKITRSELERRGEYMQQIHSQFRGDHPLVQMIKRCLENFPEDRPAIQQVVQLLNGADINSNSGFCETDRLGVIRVMEGEDHMTEWDGEGEGREGLAEQLEELRATVQAKDKQICSLQDSLEAHQKLVESQKEEIARLKKQLAHSVELSGSNTRLKEEKILQAEALESKPESKLQTSNKTLSSKWSFRWRKGKDLPFGVNRAQAVVIDNKVLLGGGFTSDDDNLFVVQQYDLARDEWTRLPVCPVRNFAMTVVSKQLVLSGGVGSDAGVTVWDSLGQHWNSEHYPESPAGSRSVSAAIGYNHYLLVASGVYTRERVDILDCSAHQWYSTSSVPEGDHVMSSVVVGDRWYLSTYKWSSFHPQIFSAHIPSLIASATSSQATPTWESVPVPQTHMPTLLSLQNQLVLAGRKEWGRELYRFNVETQTWKECGHLPVGIHTPSFAVLPSGELLVAGGDVECQGDFYSQQVWIGTIECSL